MSNLDNSISTWSPSMIASIPSNESSSPALTPRFSQPIITPYSTKNSHFRNRTRSHKKKRRTQQTSLDSDDFNSAPNIGRFAKWSQSSSRNKPTHHSFKELDAKLH